MKKKYIFHIAAIIIFAFLCVTSREVGAAKSNLYSSVELNKHNATIYKKCSVKLVALVRGRKQSVQWKSSNPSIAFVSPKGKVTGKKAGEATITAKVNGVTAACKITVKNPTIKLNKTKATIYTLGKKTVQLSAKVKGQSTKVVWKSSKPSVAAVNAKGKVTAKKAGKTVISAKSNGKTAKCTITVVKKISDSGGDADVVSAVITNYDNTAKLTVTLSDGSKLEKMYDEKFWDSLYKDTDETGWFPGLYANVQTADLNDDGKKEILVEIGVTGSTYGATMVFVYKTEDHKLKTLFQCDAGDTGESISVISDGYLSACTGAEILNSRLIVYGIKETKFKTGAVILQFDAWGSWRVIGKS